MKLTAFYQPVNFAPAPVFGVDPAKDEEETERLRQEIERRAKERAEAKERAALEAALEQSQEDRSIRADAVRDYFTQGS
jgi:hypothetical protein